MVVSANIGRQVEEKACENTPTDQLAKVFHLTGNGKRRSNVTMMDRMGISNCRQSRVDKHVLATKLHKFEICHELAPRERMLTVTIAAGRQNDSSWNCPYPKDEAKRLVLVCSTSQGSQRGEPACF